MKKATVFIIVGVLVVAVTIGAIVLLGQPETAQAGETKKASEKDESLYFSVGEAFVTNVKDSEVLLKASVVLKVGDKKQEEFLKAHTAVIRDIILFELRSRNETEIRDPQAQATLSATICERLNEQFDADFFLEAYFTDMVVQ